MNVASTAGFQPGPLMAVYYATKAYVISFSEALANELTGKVSLSPVSARAYRDRLCQPRRQRKSRLFKQFRPMDAKPVALAGIAGL